MAKQREIAIENLGKNKNVSAEIIKLISATYSDTGLSVENLASENFLLDTKDDFEGIKIKISKNADYNKFFSLFKKKFEINFVFAKKLPEDITFEDVEDIAKGIKLSITHDNNGVVEDASIKINFDLFNKICESSLDQIGSKFGGLINLKTAQQQELLRRASTVVPTAPIPSNSEFVEVQNQQRLTPRIYDNSEELMTSRKQDRDEKEMSIISTTSEEESSVRYSPSLNSICSLSPISGRRLSLSQSNVTANTPETTGFSMTELQQALAARLVRGLTERKI